MSGKWDAILTLEDRAVLARGRWAQRAGFGKSPALLLIDCQYYMAGIRGAPDNAAKYPLACGEAAFAAIDQMARLLNAARAARIPILFTRYVVDPVNDDVGMFHRKIGAGVGRGDNLYFAGTHGAEIVADLKPLPNEIIIDKKKFSAFLGTPLLSLLIDRRVDTLIIVGGSTSNCIRAAALDSTQYNFFTIVPEEAVYDRLPFAHALNLFDINRSYGDVVPVDEALAYLATVAP
ncbi:MAG TPA: isochorismatase family protein [Sphingomicrobium sp.]|jgi:maleamate amidohydrolase|nr:isochorismatase family protein [Sphingomicrobium sp.]